MELNNLYILLHFHKLIKLKINLQKKFVINFFILNFNVDYFLFKINGDGDWGLGIGDW